MNFRDMTGEQLRAYKSFHAPELERALAIARLAFDTLGNEIKTCEAYENSRFTVASFSEKLEEAALSFLPEELRDHLANTTAPRLPLETPQSSIAHSKSSRSNA